MPRNCSECPVALSGKYCRINKTYTTFIELPIRPDHCPLVEFPEKHGNLIDIDSKIEVQFFDEQEEEWSLKTVTVGDYLCYASEIPGVVVEAEGDKE